MGRLHAMILIVAGCSLTIATGFACDTPPASVALGQAPGEYASAYCERLFDCCADSEIATTFPGANVVDIPSCEAHVTRVFGNEFIDDTQRAIAMTTARYDPFAMARCLDHLRGDACPDLARVFRLTVFPADCPIVRIPEVGVGDACDHDFQCESGLCAGGGEMQTGVCADPPAIGAPCVDGQCVAGAYCSREMAPAGICAPLGADGADCASAFECASFACMDSGAGMPGRCGAPETCTGRRTRADREVHESNEHLIVADR